MLIGISDQMGAKTDRLRCEVFQNLILIPINTGPLRHAVATVLTVYGIETLRILWIPFNISPLQQYLPFTALKPLSFATLWMHSYCVATVLTVYGIETKVLHIIMTYSFGCCCNSTYRLRH